MSKAKIILSISVLLLLAQHSIGQPPIGQASQTLLISYDTAYNSGLTVLPNLADSAVIIADDGFNRDKIKIELDGKTYLRTFTTEEVLGLAGAMKIPKTKNMKLVFTLNGKDSFTVDFDKRFSCVHISMANNKISWSYTNKEYTYE